MGKLVSVAATRVRSAAERGRAAANSVAWVCERLCTMTPLQQRRWRSGKRWREHAQGSLARRHGPLFTLALPRPFRLEWPARPWRSFTHTERNMPEFIYDRK